MALLPHGKYRALMRSVLEIPKMDCPAEQRMIRMALGTLPDHCELEFELATRRLTITHASPVEAVLARLSPLGLGTRLISSHPTTNTPAENTDQAEARVLWLLLAINGAMFAIEMTLGFYAQSAGLIADSLDMFADAAVYGLSLYAIGRVTTTQLRVAHISGGLQILLALGALAEIGRRYVFGSEPWSDWMMGVALLALIANVSCLVLISGHRHGTAPMRASWIFSSNDVLANAGVIGAGALVAWTGSNFPDLIIGTLIALIVLRGAIKILRL